jgi:hypothetical protein
MKLTTSTQILVDGVMQANGGRNEKLEPERDKRHGLVVEQRPGPSSGPAGRAPRRTDAWREAVIAELRGEVRMSAVAIADALGMPERTVRGVIRRLGLTPMRRLAERNKTAAAYS